MEIKPYIGITGIQTLYESEILCKFVGELGLPESHQLMLGGLASYKGLRRGEVSDPNQYVVPFELNRALVGDPNILNVVHYNSRYEGLLEQIKDVLKVVEYADGIQLNVPGPELEMLAVLRAETAPVVILQLSVAASEVLDHEPARIATRLAEYEGLVDYVLIDPSGGPGRGFLPEYAHAMLTACVGRNLEIRWGIAGGLGPGRLKHLSSF